MKLLPLVVCLLVVFSGCVVVEDSGTGTRETRTDTVTAIYEQPAQTPIRPETPSGRSGVNVPRLERLIHQRVNEVRTTHELEPLVYDQRLAAIGRYHSWDMAQGDYFAHKNPEGITHDQMRSDFEYKCDYSGQNLAFVAPPGNVDKLQEELSNLSSLATSIVQGWLDSPEHRENLLSPHYDAEGIGVFVTENGSVYVTQEFCG